MARVTTPISVGMVLPSISRRKRSTYITLPYTVRPLLSHSRTRISRKRASTALVTFSRSSVSAAEASTNCGVLEVDHINAGYHKWQWKGQYSINYFVSGPFTNSPLSPRPSSLLLVHGFGASIPHWRRWSIHIISLSYGSSHHLSAFFPSFWTSTHVSLSTGISPHCPRSTLSMRLTFLALAPPTSPLALPTPWRPGLRHVLVGLSRASLCYSCSALNLRIFFLYYLLQLIMNNLP